MRERLLASAAGVAHLIGTGAGKPTAAANTGRKRAKDRADDMEDESESKAGKKAEDDEKHSFTNGKHVPDHRTHLCGD